MQGKLICQACHRDEMIKSMGNNVIHYDSIEDFMKAINEPQTKQGKCLP